MKHVVDGVTYKSRPRCRSCVGCVAQTNGDLCDLLPCAGVVIFVVARPKIKMNGVTYKAVPEVEQGMCSSCAGANDDTLCQNLRASGPKDGDGVELCLSDSVIWVVKAPKEFKAEAFTPWHVDVDGVRYESRLAHHNSCEGCATQEGDRLCNKLGRCDFPRVVFVKTGLVEPTQVTVNVAFTFDGVSKEQAVEHTGTLMDGQYAAHVLDDCRESWEALKGWEIESVTGRGETFKAWEPIK